MALVALCAGCSGEEKPKAKANTAKKPAAGKSGSDKNGADQSGSGGKSAKNGGAKGSSKTQAPRRLSRVSIEKTNFGTTKDGVDVEQYTLTNKSGVTVKLITLGATLTSVVAPDRDQKPAEITLGFKTLAEYENNPAYFGSTVGRYANRIAGGKFTLDGEEYTLATNDGANHLHGGVTGFHKRVWAATLKQDRDSAQVIFNLHSRDGEEGYPGTINVAVAYTLTTNNELKIDYVAKSDRATVLNLTNHAYWNLAGAGSGDILGHRLMIDADKYLPVDAAAIPTGEMAEVKDTPFDFKNGKTIGEDIGKVEGEPGGYDHCFVLSDHQRKEPKFVAELRDLKSGRVLMVSTDQPGIQLYTGNFLDGSPGVGGFGKRTAVCLETQHFPDSPNQEGFPSTVLKQGETFRSSTVYEFSARF
jgi:aldose 1-epimerase